MIYLIWEKYGKELFLLRIHIEQESILLINNK